MFKSIKIKGYTFLINREKKIIDLLEKSILSCTDEDRGYYSNDWDVELEHRQRFLNTLELKLSNCH